MAGDGARPYWGCPTTRGGKARSAAFTSNDGIVKNTIAAPSASRGMTAFSGFVGARSAWRIFCSHPRKGRAFLFTVTGNASRVAISIVLTSAQDASRLQD